MNPDIKNIDQADHFSTATEALLDPSSLDVNALQSVLGNIMTHKVDYVDLYFQYSRSESWGLEEGQVKSGNFSIDQGVGVRAVSGGKTAFAYSDDINLTALQQAAEVTKAIADAGADSFDHKKRVSSIRSKPLNYTCHMIQLPH
jgi:TldD protein